MLKKSEIKIGDSHKETLVEDLKRTQIVQYAGSSGDYNPLHTDEVFTTKIATHYHYRPYAAKNNAVDAGDDECVLLMVPCRSGTILVGE